MKSKNILILTIMSIASVAIGISFHGEKNISLDRTDQEISLSELRLDYIKRLNHTLDLITREESEFPLHEMIKIHQKRMLGFEDKGYPTDFYQKVFNEWFIDRFGIDLTKDTIDKVGESYNVKVKDFKNAKLVFHEEEDKVQVYMQRQESDASIHLRPNISFPKSRNENYKFVYKENSPIQVIPVNRQIR